MKRNSILNWNQWKIFRYNNFAINLKHSTLGESFHNRINKLKIYRNNHMHELWNTFLNKFKRVFKKQNTAEKLRIFRTLKRNQDILLCHKQFCKAKKPQQKRRNLRRIFDSSNAIFAPQNKNIMQRKWESFLPPADL